MNHYGPMDSSFHFWLWNDETSVIHDGHGLAQSPFWIRGLYLFYRNNYQFNSKEAENKLHPFIHEQIYLCTHVFPVEFVETVGLEWEPKPDGRDKEVADLKELQMWAWDSSEWLKSQLEVHHG